MQPDLLVLDEPFSQLDRQGRKRLLETLNRLKSRQTNIVISEHNLDPLMDLIDRLVVMSDGRIILDRPAEQLAPSDLRTIRSKGVRWRLLEDNNGREIKPNGCRCPGASRIFVKDLSYSYPNGRSVLRGASLRVGGGEFLGVVGENGSGKSTLLKCVIGLLKPEKGRIVVTGIEDPTPESLFGRVGVLLQNPDCQLFEETVFDEIAFSLRKVGLSEREVAKRVRQALSVVKMTEHETSNPLRLSVGEKRRTILTSILAMQPKVILLDEPTHGLDLGNAERILSALKTMQERMDTTILMSSHDQELLRLYADRLAEIGDGHIEDIE
jgi:energy-coupling factor transport system ATP-binding protein